MTDVYAHSLSGRPEHEWECLGDHLQAVAELASRFAEAFGWARIGEVLGRLHDIGKVSSEFQAYIRKVVLEGESGRGGDHSTAGAKVAVDRYKSVGRMLAYGIAGHHAGLADAADLDRRLGPAHVIPAYAGWEAHAGVVPDMASAAPTSSIKTGPHRGFGWAFRTRMLFSCLVDADFHRHRGVYAAAEGRVVERGSALGPAELLARLRRFEAERGADGSALNALRTDIRAHAIGKAGLEPGPFTLTVPTGGGKTLTSLSFALERWQ